MPPPPRPSGWRRKHQGLMLGKARQPAAAIEAMGGRHKARTVDMIQVDDKNNIVTTPAYMLGPGIKEVAEGIRKLVDKVLSLVA